MKEYNIYNKTRQGYVLRNTLKLVGYFFHGRLMTKKFDKPSLNFKDQLEKLIQRGLIVNDKENALDRLSNLNYYRLAAYWLPFQEDGGAHNFKEGAEFETVLNHYLFDSKLRLLVSGAIEKIEISFRTQWAYHFSQNFGSHCYTIENASIVRNIGHLRSSLDELACSISRSDEKFIVHHRQAYEEDYPPAWVACEVMSLGLISRFYSNLRAYRVRKSIADTYGLDEKFLEGFMEHLTYVRNICAHHSRLWNRHLNKKMPLVKNKPKGLRENLNLDDPKAEHRIYNTLVLIKYFLSIVDPDSGWDSSLKELVSEHEINVEAMGFPANWNEMAIWKDLKKR